MQLNTSIFLQRESQFTGQKSSLESIDVSDQLFVVICCSDLFQTVELQGSLLIRLIDHRQNTRMSVVQRPRGMMPDTNLDKEMDQFDLVDKLLSYFRNEEQSHLM